MKKQNINPRLLTLTTAALSVAIIAVCSWISIPAFGPFVPFTLQTFAIFLIAGLFDMKTSLLSVVVYVLLGAAGVPVFSGFKGGIGSLLGPTGGYIIGFIFSVLIIELFKQIKPGSTVILIVGMILGLAVCYLFGTVWFYVVFSRGGDVKSFSAILSMCVIPFIIPDAIKMALALILVNRLSVPLSKIGLNAAESKKAKAA